jgi:hypothetical protein
VEKTTGAVGGGRADHLRGRAGFDHAAGVHKDDLGGGLAGEFHVVRHHDHRRAVGGELAHDGEDFAGELGVERARGFVEEQHGRLDGEGAGDGGALLLAAGELGRVGVGFVGEADAVEQGKRTVAGGVGREPADEAGGEREIFPDAQVGEEVELLKDHADAGAVGVERGVVTRVDEGAVAADFAGVGEHEKVEATEQRGFAGAAGAEDGGDGAGGDSERDGVEGDEGFEALGEGAGFEQGCGRGGGLRRHGGGSGFPTRARRARPAR